MLDTLVASIEAIDFRCETPIPPDRHFDHLYPPVRRQEPLDNGCRCICRSIVDNHPSEGQVRLINHRLNGSLNVLFFIPSGGNQNVRDSRTLLIHRFSQQSSVSICRFRSMQEYPDDRTTLPTNIYRSRSLGKRMNCCYSSAAILYQSALATNGRTFANHRSVPWRETIERFVLRYILALCSSQASLLNFRLNPLDCQP